MRPEPLESTDKASRHCALLLAISVDLLLLLLFCACSVVDIYAVSGCKIDQNVVALARAEGAAGRDLDARVVEGGREELHRVPKEGEVRAQKERHVPPVHGPRGMPVTPLFKQRCTAVPSLSAAYPPRQKYRPAY